MGLLSNAKPGSHGSAGFIPLDEPLLELLDVPDVVSPLELLPIPTPPVPPLPAVPDDSVFVVPPSPDDDEPVDEQAVNPAIANPSGKHA